MAEKEISCSVLKVFNDKNSRRGKTKIQVVKWGNYPPVLEKREFWYDENDEEKTGKAKGFSGDDFEILMQNADEIRALLNKGTSNEGVSDN